MEGHKKAHKTKSLGCMWISETARCPSRNRLTRAPYLRVKSHAVTIITDKMKFLFGVDVGVGYFIQFQPVVTELNIVNELSVTYTLINKSLLHCMLDNSWDVRLLISPRKSNHGTFTSGSE